MNRKVTTDQLLDILKKENIHTWFDLGLFIDKFKEDNEANELMFEGSLDELVKEQSHGGAAFITFHYMVDGVTVEVGKYAKLFQRNIPGISIHYIAGNFNEKSDTLIDPKYKKHQIPEMAGFGEWKLYDDMFLTKLERGSAAYNELIINLWNECLTIVEKLGRYIEEEKLGLLYIINVCSNPGNVAAALALVILSEFMGIPVINNNHDFYWEGGNSKFDRKTQGLKSGPRDFFFTNAHLGEVFSIIEMIFPWSAKHWINVNINKGQTEHLIRQNGHNPASVLEVGTAVDTDEYTKIDKRRKINSFLQFEKILARYEKQLICYSVNDVLKSKLVSQQNPRPILIGHKTKPVNKFIAENIIFLQPTRIISRKRIELGFNMLLKMLSNEEMVNKLGHTPNLKLTLLITGPIAEGHFEYYKKLVKHFGELLEGIEAAYSDRLYLAFLLGELDKERFISKFENPIGIPELYNIASLIMLPSETEGRGLPIIEATACGTPIFCSRYVPEEVYSEVIGEHLKEKERLKVLEFKGKKISKKIVSKIINRVFFPHKYADETKHNKKVVEKRYSLNALNENIQQIIQRLYSQLLTTTETQGIADKALREYAKRSSFTNEDLEFIINRKNRQYMPGYGQMYFMLMLKSLIDPSYFRSEQQRVKGAAFYFANKLINNVTNLKTIPEEVIHEFYNAVDLVFKIRKGEAKIRHDHSMSYRHRNKNHYPYQQFTFQELTGLVNLLYLKIVKQAPQNKVDLSPQFFTDWNLALLQLSSSKYLAIDNRKLLIEKLQTNLPIAYFPGEFITYELEFFALQSIRSRLKLPIEEEVRLEHIENHTEKIAPVYIFAQRKNLGKQLTKEEIENYLAHGKSQELQLLFEQGLIRVISTEQLSVGIHFPQLGAEALKTLRCIREEGGYLLTNRRNAALMTDIVNIDRFHIGQVKTRTTENIMGIPVDSGYIQYIPAGMRVTLAYPTPIQTAKDFDCALNSELFNELLEKMGRKELMDILQKDAEERGSPIMHVLENLRAGHKEKDIVEFEYVSGIYEDYMPYNGVIGKLNTKKAPWQFKAISTKTKPQTVSAFVSDFEEETGHKAKIAWNGGYILNAELVGKLGLPESYIGSPLGMLIMEGKCICPPLFNKAALLIRKDGQTEIKKVNCKKGLKITSDNWNVEFNSTHYNNPDPGDEPAYYDLLYKKKSISAKRRIIVRLAGNHVKEVIKTKEKEEVEIIPVGITLSFPASRIPGNIIVEEEVRIEINGYEDILHAIEAGPMLLNDNEIAIDMESEGWKTANSISTQAARLDYTDMRGPKIAVGMNTEGEIAVLTINGRIRESVGATHVDMAQILKKFGMVTAMGFDPGGSSTLVINGQTMNISPYNHNYEENVYSLPPEPRAVSNAVIGYVES
ncbi:phosphodiester glycosidase family protein [Bacteroidota bacterium]